MPRTSRPRPLPLVVAPAVAAVLLTGCGPTAPADPQASPSSSSSSASVVLAELSAATSGAGTARVQVRTEASAGQEGGASFSSTGVLEGVVDFASGDAQLVTELPTGGQLESRSVDGVRYLRLPDGLGGRDGQDRDKPWQKIPAPQGADPGLGGLMDPVGGLSLLREAGGPLTEVGRERVREVDTVHYRTELDLAELPTPSPPANPEDGEGRPAPDGAALLKRLLGDRPLPVEVWVDDQQRIRRLTLVLPIPDLSQAAQPDETEPDGAEPQGAGPDASEPAASGGPASSPPAGPAAGGSSTSTTEFFEFGVAVDVQPPPADQVRTAPRRLPLPGGSAASPSPTS